MTAFQKHVTLPMISRELSLLISPLDRLGISQSILVVELNLDVVIRGPAIQTSTLDTSHVWHKL